MPDDNLDPGLPDGEQPTGDGLVNQPDVSNEGDSPDGGQSQQPATSAFQSLKAKKNWASDEDVAQGYESVEAYARKVANENAELAQRIAALEGQSPASADDEDDPIELIVKRVTEAVTGRVGEQLDPLRQEIYSGHLNNAEREVAEAIGPNFAAFKASPIYRNIVETARNSQDPVRTYQGLVMGVLEAADSMSGNPKAAFQSGVETGRTQEQALSNSQLLPAGSSGGATNQPAPRDEAQEILAAAQRLRGRNVLGV